MTKQTSAALKTQVSTLLQDGGVSGTGIPASDHRTTENDTHDSVLNHLDLTNAATYDGQGLRCNKVTGLVEPGDTSSVTNTVSTTSTLTTPGFYEASAAAGSITVSLPAAPAEGDTFEIARVDTTSNTLLISGNGSTINGSSQQPLISYDCLKVRFSTNQTRWIVI